MIDDGKSNGNENEVNLHRENRSRTRRFLSPSRYPVLSGEKFTTLLLIVLSIIFTVFVFALSVYYIYFYFYFDMNIASRRSKDEENKTSFICSIKTKPSL